MTIETIELFENYLVKQGKLHLNGFGYYYKKKSVYRCDLMGLALAIVNYAEEEYGEGKKLVYTPMEKSRLFFIKKQYEMIEKPIRHVCVEKPLSPKNLEKLIIHLSKLISSS